MSEKPIQPAPLQSVTPKKSNSLSTSTPICHSEDTSRFSVAIPLEPVAKGRPRLARSGVAFTPSKTRKAEQDIRYWLHREKAPKFDGPLKVVMGFGFERPKSVSEKKRPHHITPPDLDNLIKTVGDAGNGILWEDDKQIVELKCFKYYSKAPIITITVERVSREIP